MPYGGLGGNFELGAGHFSGFGAFGYAPKTSDGTAIIKASYNYQAGIRYYFDVGSKHPFPKSWVRFWLDYKLL